MNWLSVFAIYFVVWWVTLFAMLPIGVRAHDSTDHAVRATRGSAPDHPRMGLKVVLTTIVAAILVGLFYFVTGTLGLSVDDIPRIVPEYSRPGGVE